MGSARASHVFAIAMWSAVLFGLLEGVVLCITRADTLIQAAHKVSPDILWVAPLVDLVLFCVASAVLFVALALARRWISGWQLQIVYGLFLFTGIFTVITVPRKIHSVSAAILAAGIAVVLSRKLRPYEERLASHLRARVYLLPPVLVAVALGVFAVESGYERMRARALPVAKSGAENVLIIVLDTVRADRFLPFAKTSLTPYLDKIAAQGVSFDNAWSTTSWSLPSQASILTGRHPHEHRADWPSVHLSTKYTGLPEYFASHGYATGAFSGNAAWITPEYLGRGFLRFQVYHLEDLARRTVHGRKIDRLLEKVQLHSAGRGKKAPAVNTEFLHFLDDYRGRPFFAYLCYMDVNQGFHDRMFNHHGDEGRVPAAEIARASDIALRTLDSHIGELFSELRRRQLLDKTLVIITSDHGESFGANNPGDHDPFGHGSSLYREQSAVPLFLVRTGKAPVGRHVNESVSIRQIPATVADLLNLKDAPFPGKPLSSYWKDQGSTTALNATLLADLRDLDGSTIAQSVISGRWHYLHHPHDRDKLKKGEELYDFVADPLEKTNLVSASDWEMILGQMRGDLRLLLSAGSEPQLDAAERHTRLMHAAHFRTVEQKLSR